MILGLLRGENAPGTVTLPVELIVRESTAPQRPQGGVRVRRVG